MSAPVTPSPVARLTALLVTMSGASVKVPRKLLAEVVQAQEAADRVRSEAALAQALTRVVTNREAALASVPLARVWGYLRDHGWTPITTDGVWERDGHVTETPALGTMLGYAPLLWRVVEDVAGVEKRPPLLVLADWLVA